VSGVGSLTTGGRGYLFVDGIPAVSAGAGPASYIVVFDP
jgi:hypothetical protein